MKRYLGAARKSTQVEKILVLILESGFVYIVLCVSLSQRACNTFAKSPQFQTLQAVPIYGAKLKPAGLTAFNVVNSIIQQAIVSRTLLRSLIMNSSLH